MKMNKELLEEAQQAKSPEELADGELDKVSGAGQ